MLSLEQVPKRITLYKTLQAEICLKKVTVLDINTEFICGQEIIEGTGAGGTDKCMVR